MFPSTVRARYTAPILVKLSAVSVKLCTCGAVRCDTFNITDPKTRTGLLHVSCDGQGLTETRETWAIGSRTQSVLRVMRPASTSNLALSRRQHSAHISRLRRRWHFQLTRDVSCENDAPYNYTRRTPGTPGRLTLISSMSGRRAQQRIAHYSKQVDRLTCITCLHCGRYDLNGL
ncbi:hypothetical protein BD413DRAFT_560106 [Trametes elegans]|nr:hypothetical protein BD413DRAFT_560106 [Trametes elegans]